MATDYPLMDANLMGRMRDGDRLPAGQGTRLGSGASGLSQPGYTYDLPPGGGAVPVDGSPGNMLPTRDGTSYADNGTAPRRGVPLGTAGMDPSHVTDGMTMPIPGDFPSDGSRYPNIVVEPTRVSESGGHIERGMRDAANPPI